MATLKKAQASKKGNKHATNSRRNERKYGRTKKAPEPGKYGSSYCDRKNDCIPWK